jgi:hypothetical protein
MTIEYSLKKATVPLNNLKGDLVMLAVVLLDDAHDDPSAQT